VRDPEVPGIYGPNRLPLDRLQRDEPVLCPEDCGPGNRIHVDDLVTVCVAALDTLASGAINVADGDYASTTDYLCATAELAGLPRPRFVTRRSEDADIARHAAVSRRDAARGQHADARGAARAAALS
jgi:nucleoside-diphosphate-sugar epimerase